MSGDGHNGDGNGCNNTWCSIVGDARLYDNNTQCWVRLVVRGEVDVNDYLPGQCISTVFTAIETLAGDAELNSVQCGMELVTHGEVVPCCE